MDLYFVNHMVSSFFLSLVAGVPLLLFAGCCIPALRAISFRLLPWSPLPALFAVLFATSGIEVHVAWFFMGSTMGLDAAGRIFLGFTAVIWLFAAQSVMEKFRHDARRFAFAGYFLTSMAGNFGLILAREILGFYLFFALMSFSAYGLIVHTRSRESLKAGRVYLMLVFLSELAMFTGLVILGMQGSPAGFSTVLLLLLYIAFGIKVGALPFQSWMVPSYQQIPVPAATALAGAMVNAGILGWVRFLPFGHVALPGGGAFFILMGAAAALYGVVFGLYQERIGRLLASSSISQMGLVTMIGGYGLLSEAGGRSALVLMTLFGLHHSLAKSSLFLGYDMAERGIRLRGTILLAGILVPCLSLAGLPVTSGAMLKGGLKELAGLEHGPWYIFGKVFLPFSSLGTTILMLHCTRLFRRLGRTESVGVGKMATLRWLISIGAVIAVPWLWPPLQELGLHSLELQTLLQALWPVFLGLVLALAWFFLGSPLPGRGKDVADFDSLVRWAYGGFMQGLSAVTGIVDRAGESLKPGRLKRFYKPVAAVTGGPGKWEKVLGRWSVVGLCYLLICILLFIIMLSGMVL
jgi:formate hydrogenlyase subunit 3/multisubunit Na+/H+ antiporter MnhD subunit